MDVSQSQTLIDQLSAHVKHGDHLCVVCEDPHARLEVAAQYIVDGLCQNEVVMYAAGEETTGILQRMLAQRGIDVEAEMKRGALNLPTAYQAYLRDGDFDPDLMYQAFDQAIDDALAAGFSGCRFAGEPIWAIDRESLRPGLIEFEMRLNELFRTRKATGLCVYDKNAWPASVVRDVLRTHPIAVVDDLVCKRNLYYERPDLIDQKGSAEQQVDWMLSQLRELRRHEARLQIALEAGRLGSWELDLSTNTSVRSLRHDEIFGYDRPVSNWDYTIFMQHVLPEDRERVDAAFHASIEQGTTWQFECRIRRHNDGSIRWIEAHGRPDPDNGNGKSVQRLLGIVADITERKEMEQALRDSDRRKDEFLATLAHELRNPLAPIVNALQLMQLKSSEDSQLQNVHRIIERQVRHLVRLVDDLLEMSRITTGHIELQRERVELRTVLASAIEASQPLFDASRHEFWMTMPEEPIYLEGDTTRLAQIFLNILNNAARYTPKGGHIKLTASYEMSQIIVRVRDNGMGIPPDLIPDMFKMFVQGHKTGQVAQGGLGIGLSLAKQLVELHGGSIEARSEGFGCGSEFIVRLPASRKHDQPSPAASRNVSKTSGTLRILVVDDNIDAADVLATTLDLLGHEVATCYDGMSSLETLARFKPDIAILDIGLPDLDGYQLAQRFRALRPNITLVALTGWGQEKDRLRAHQAGFDLHRTKPVDPTDLLAATLDIHHASSRLRIVR